MESLSVSEMCIEAKAISQNYRLFCKRTPQITYAHSKCLCLMHRTNGAAHNDMEVMAKLPNINQKYSLFSVPPTSQGNKAVLPSISQQRSRFPEKIKISVVFGCFYLPQREEHNPEDTINAAMQQWS